MATSFKYFQIILSTKEPLKATIDIALRGHYFLGFY
jgi:hypothetical protein